MSRGYLCTLFNGTYIHCQKEISQHVCYRPIKSVSEHGQPRPTQLNCEPGLTCLPFRPNTRSPFLLRLPYYMYRLYIICSRRPSVVLTCADVKTPDPTWHDRPANAENFMRRQQRNDWKQNHMKTGSNVFVLNRFCIISTIIYDILYGIF